jgi:branched-chain amino acid transport system ATP-binding protein
VNVRSGAVTLEGEDITNQKANQLVQAGIGFVPQTNNVFPSLTIEENMQMGMFLRPKEFQSRVAEIWELFPCWASVASSVPARSPAASASRSPWRAPS